MKWGRETFTRIVQWSMMISIVGIVLPLILTGTKTFSLSPDATMAPAEQTARELCIVPSAEFKTIQFAIKYNKKVKIIKEKEEIEAIEVCRTIRITSDQDYIIEANDEDITIEANIRFTDPAIQGATPILVPRKIPLTLISSQLQSGVANPALYARIITKKSNEAITITGTLYPVIIRGLLITHGTSVSGVGIKANNAGTITISNNIIDGTPGSSTGPRRITKGIFLDSVVAATVEETTIMMAGDNGIEIRNIMDKVDIIKSNVIGSAAKGIVLEKSVNVVVSESELAGNEGDGLTINSSRAVTVSKNQFRTNTGNGLTISNSSGLRISGNEIRGNDMAGLSIEDSSDLTIGLQDKDKIKDEKTVQKEKNEIAENKKHGIRLFKATKVTIIGNRITDNRVGINNKEDGHGVFLQQTPESTKPEAVTLWRNEILRNGACGLFLGNLFSVQGQEEVENNIVGNQEGELCVMDP
jgi:parallel beta-helix repeat protein